MQYDSFHRAYLANLKDIYTSYEFINSPRGNGSYEKLNTNFTITNPLERICYTPARRTNIVFNVAEALWYLSGSDSLGFIGYYADGIKRYSSDGRTLTGSAYGPKIMRFGRGAINQWDRVVDILGGEDPDSKRAMIGIFDPNEDLSLSNIDVSCTVGLQFLLREDKLHMVASMRANDAYRGIVSDVFSFTFIHELMAMQLGVAVGNYYHAVGSMHVYKQDEARVKEVLKDAAADAAPGVKPEGIAPGLIGSCPEMPATNNWPHLRIVFEIEKSLRETGPSDSLHDIERRLPEYWFQIVLLLTVYSHIQRDRVDVHLINRLSPWYQFLVRNKWRKLQF